MNLDAQIERLREMAEFGLRIGHKNMDGHSAAFYAQDLLEACELLGVLRERLQRAETARQRLANAASAIVCEACKTRISPDAGDADDACECLRCRPFRVALIAALVPEEAAEVSPFSANTTLKDSQPAKDDA